MIEWNATPEIFHIGRLFVRWYSLCFIAAFILGYLLLRWMLIREKKPVAYADELLIYVFLGTVIGARLGHCLFYNAEYYLTHPIDIVKVWRGGLASHGAAIGILTALYIFARRRPDVTFWWAADRTVIVVALSGLFIRLGNLFNSEVIGKPTDVPWAFVFTRVDDIPRHPTQLYEGLAYLGVFFLLLQLYRKRSAALIDGQLLAVFLASIFTIRFFTELTKKTPVVLDLGLPFTMGQLLSLPFIVLGIALYLRLARSR
jgi:prolipoprotein diacylglyceryl transferase